MTKLRVFTFGLVSTVLMLAWVFPAMAHQSTVKATVNVIEGKPSEFRYTLSVKSVPHGAVTFKITNKGTVPHDFKVCSSSKGGSANTCKGTGTVAISPGGSATLKITFKTAGTYEYLCTLPAHAQLGMKGDLKVT